MCVCVFFASLLFFADPLESKLVSFGSHPLGLFQKHFGLATLWIAMGLCDSNAERD